MTRGEALADLTRSYLDLRWNLDPVEATRMSAPGHDHRLGDFSDGSIQTHLAALRALSHGVESLEVASLDDEIDRTALLNAIRAEIHILQEERPFRRNPSMWVTHILEGLYLLLVREEVDERERAARAWDRLRGIPDFLAVAEETVSGMPSVFIETAIDVAEGGMTLIDQVVARFAATMGSEIEPTQHAAKAALRAFKNVLENALPTAPNDAFAVGEDAFNRRLTLEHALDAQASSLWREGVAWIEGVRADIIALAREIDPVAPWPDIVARLRDDHPRADQLVGAYAEEMHRARRFVDERQLATLPDGELRVVETPTFLTPIIPFAAYQPPGVFGTSNLGRFYVTQPGPDEDASRLLRDHCWHEIPTTALHEGYPGHHLQFLHARAQPRLVRKVVATPLLFEGWALYCEELMGEEGFYRTAEERLFQKLALLWRVARVVLDVGLHTQGMSVDGAVRMLQELVLMEPANAETEVRRYCAEPAYQLCYAVGGRELRALREDYRAAVGTSYDHRTFHAAVLSYGGIPVSLIRWGMGLA